MLRVNPPRTIKSACYTSANSRCSLTVKRPAVSLAFSTLGRVRTPVQSDEVMSRRDLLTLIGMTAGCCGDVSGDDQPGASRRKSGYKGRIKLEGDPKGASVLILGAGLAGMTAALELRQAGYKVQILEYNEPRRRPQLDAARRRQLHRARRRHAEMRVRRGPLHQPRPVAHPLSPQRPARLLQAARRRSSSRSSRSTTTPSCIPRKAFGGKPQRMRDIKTDFQGHVSELLAKVTQKGKLEEPVTKEDQEMLLEALQLLGRARRGLCLQRPASSAPSSVATRRTRAAGCGAAPVPGDADRPAPTS